MPDLNHFVYRACRRYSRARALSMVASLLAIFSVPILTCDALQSPGEGDITVTVCGLKNNSGMVRVSLFGSAETYNNDHNIGMGSFRNLAAPIVANSAVVTFTGMPYGDYAVKAFHDENNSGKFLTNAFGRPRVEVAFSNDARGRHSGPPPFRRARFLLSAAKLSLPINVRKSW